MFKLLEHTTKTTLAETLCVRLLSIVLAAVDFLVAQFVFCPQRPCTTVWSGIHVISFQVSLRSTAEPISRMTDQQHA